MEKTIKINKIQGFLLVFAGIVLLSAMCFAVVFANFAITDKVASAEELPIDPLEPSSLDSGIRVGDTGHWLVFPRRSIVFSVSFDWTRLATFFNGYYNIDIEVFNNSSSFLVRTVDTYNNATNLVYNYNKSTGLVNTVDLYCFPSVLTCIYEIDLPGTVGAFLRNFLHGNLSLCDSLPDIYNNAGYNLLVPDYNALVNKYNQLEENYNNLVESTQYVTVANNSGSIYTGEFGTYGSDLLFTGNFNEGVVATFVGRDNTSPYEQVLGFVNLGDTFVAGSNIKFTYHVLSSFASSEHVHLGVIHDGTIHDVFVTSSDNEVNEDFYNVEFVLPYDTSTLVLYSGANVFAISAFTIQVRTNATQALIDSAYQRGVESVNVNAYIQQGYDAGYYAGLSEDNPYTFRSLIGAVVDAPLDVFTQMFDFDILGVNMKGLYLSLFTLALVILVIKFALARG